MSPGASPAYPPEMASSHTLLARLLHWGFVPLYAYGILKQLDDLSQLEDPVLLGFEVAFASLFLVVVVLRFSYMRRFETFQGARRPISPGHGRLARALHLCMYACLAGLPLSGLLIAGLYAQGLEGGLVQDAVVEVHEVLAALSYLLIGIHITGALMSRSRREGIWSSMVPLWREDGEAGH